MIHISELLLYGTTFIAIVIAFVLGFKAGRDSMKEKK